MKNANNHDGFLKWLVKNQVIAECWNHEPADLRVARRSIADASSEFTMLCKEIGGVENRPADTLRRVRIVSGDVIESFVQIARGS